MRAAQLIEYIPNISTFKKFGKVTRVVGLMIESQGPDSSIGDVCKIHVNSPINGHQIILAEVVGFKDEIVVLMPYSSLREISIGCLVEGTGKPLSVKVGPELIGKILDSNKTPFPS